MIPVDAKVESRSDLNFGTVDLDKILASLDNPSRANIIILDACRDNPLTRRFAAATRTASVASGLAPYTALGTGTLIAFSVPCDLSTSHDYAKRAGLWTAVAAALAVASVTVGPGLGPFAVICTAIAASTVARYATAWRRARRVMIPAA